MSPFLYIAIILFLAIFAAAATLTLLSLIGKVKIAKNYQKQLFTVLLLEVIGVVIAFVSYNLKPNMSPDISEKMLTNNDGAWDWSYPESCWRTKIDFVKNKDDGSLHLEGFTYYHYYDTAKKKYNDIKIYEWKSVGAIIIPTTGKDIHIEVERKTLDGIKYSEPERIGDIGKIEKGIMNLRTDISLTGTYLSYDNHLDWGIVLNYRKK